MIEPDPTAPLASVITRFNADDRELLMNLGEEVQLDPGVILFQRGDAIDAAYVVLAGRLNKTDAAGTATEMTAGEALDDLKLLTGGRRDATVEALEPATLMRLPLRSVRRAIDDHPALLLAVSEAIGEVLRENQLAGALRDLFGDLDDHTERALAAHTEWVELDPGEELFRQNDPGDELFILIDGVLAALVEIGGIETPLNQILPGETIGEMALLRSGPRAATVRAVKPSLLVRLQREDFVAVAADHPMVYKAFAEVLANYLVRTDQGFQPKGVAREIALLPHEDDPELLAAAADRLASALAVIGPTLHLSPRRLADMGDQIPFEVRDAITLPLHEPANTRFSMWLTQQRAGFDFILYEADPTDPTWSRVCVDRADEVVVVADAAADPTPRQLEKNLDELAMIRRRLVLVHPPQVEPARTESWVAPRRLDGHHHVRLEEAGGFARLARFLAGQAIGLVLAGGGARGFAHIGVIQAFHEVGIPIDLVGGTSSGGMCALMYAMDPEPHQLRLRNQRDWVDRRPWRKYGPSALSILSHTSWSRIFQDGFAGKYIEDGWLPAFAISSNIDAGRMAIHDSGPAWRAARATSSLPALLAPVLIDGEAHVDGGLLNNLPSDVMRDRTTGPVFAVSLGQRIPERVDFDAYPPPWRLAADFLNPRKHPQPMHTLPKVMLQIATLGDLARSEQRAAEADVILSPPVEAVSMMDFSDVDGVIRIGYEHAMENFDALRDDEAFIARMAAAGVEFPKQS